MEKPAQVERACTSRLVVGSVNDGVHGESQTPSVFPRGFEQAGVEFGIRGDGPSHVPARRSGGLDDCVVGGLDEHLLADPCKHSPLRSRVPYDVGGLAAEHVQERELAAVLDVLTPDPPLFLGLERLVRGQRVLDTEYPAVDHSRRPKLGEELGDPGPLVDEVVATTGPVDDHQIEDDVGGTSQLYGEFDDVVPDERALRDADEGESFDAAEDFVHDSRGDFADNLTVLERSVGVVGNVQRAVGGQCLADDGSRTCSRTLLRTFEEDELVGGVAAGAGCCAAIRDGFHIVS